MFENKNYETELNDFIKNWKTDELNVKPAFVRLKDKLLKKKDTVLSFHSRAGITYSLRATINESSAKDNPLFAMVDIIDDDPDSRWLSVCFFGKMITDPDEIGDFVPEGLLGQDAHCFDYDNQDQEMLLYIERRIDEAHAYMSAEQNN
ncbi:MAG: hypothetical protein JJW03_04915 [Desulfosarcina sp.]|nr:hypothetical protein [Desulfobacterales bacterium]